jgi:Chitobiase/beta-hexosaminidase C-terminal domain
LGVKQPRGHSMSSIFKSRQRTAGLLSFVAILAIGVVGLAAGDVVTINEIGVTGASQKSTNSSGTLTVRLDPNDPADPVNGCNADGQATVRVTLQSSNTGAVQLANGGIVDFTSCSSRSLAYTTHNAGTATITIASVTGGRVHQGNTPTYVKTDNHVIVVAATDTTPPTSSATATTVDPAGPYVFGDWTNRDVSVSLSGSDDLGGSGLKEIRYTTNGDTPTASHGSVYSSAILFDGAGEHTLKWVAVDNAGNVESPVNSGIVKIDKTAPSVQCDAADGAWHADNVSIACTASDGASGIAEADESFSLSTTVAAGDEDANASTGSRTITDGAGNSADAGPIAGNKVDRKAPGVSCDAADGAWHADNVSLGCTASDGGSGIAEADESFSLSTTVAAGEEDADAATGSRVVTDAMGNSTTAGPIGGNMVDRKAPGVSCGAADGAWHADNVSIPCTASDGGSGIAEADESFSLSTTVAAGEEDANASTGSRTITDGAGNSTDAGPIGGNMVDRKAPGVSCGAADGAWHADNVSIACTASDGGSGIAEADESFSLSTTVAAGEEDANASTGSRTITDGAGNSADAGPIAGNKVDRKGPAITCDATPSFVLGQSPANVTGTFTDGGVGPASGSVSAAGDTSTIGASKSVTLTKTDDLGNVGSQQCSYAVIYDWNGFFAPVDNPSTGKMNGVKAGSSVPLKFSLGANAGLDIFAFAPRSTAYPCSGTAPIDPLPTDSTTAPLFSNGGLSYDALSGQYTYVWKTDKAWANQCRQLVIGLNDGTSRARALNFKMTK